MSDAVATAANLAAKTKEPKPPRKTALRVVGGRGPDMGALFPRDETEVEPRPTIGAPVQAEHESPVEGRGRRHELR